MPVDKDRQRNTSSDTLGVWNVEGLLKSINMDNGERDSTIR